MAINMTQFYSVQEAFRSELQPGESLLWSGQPDPDRWFAKEDIITVPFSVFWLGFAVFWEYQALRATWFITDKPYGPPLLFKYVFPLFGLPFVLIGIYMLFGRILIRRWTRKRTFYAVTDKRVMALVKSGKRSALQSKSIADIQDITKSVDSSGRGTIMFGPTGALGNTPQWAVGMATSLGGQRTRDQLTNLGLIMFEDIADAARVYELVSQKRLAQASEKNSY
jgi:hypothetical protein